MATTARMMQPRSLEKVDRVNMNALEQSGLAIGGKMEQVAST
jgi:hypothetical protein